MPQQIAEQLQLDVDKMFNLKIVKTDKSGKQIASESFMNLTPGKFNSAGTPTNNRVDIVLKEQSQLLRYQAGEDLPFDLNSLKKRSQKR